MTDTLETSSTPPPPPVLHILTDGDEIVSRLMRKRLREVQRNYICWAFSPGPKPRVLRQKLLPECADMPEFTWYAKDYHYPVEDL